jgi:hypothetical protein
MLEPNITLQRKSLIKQVENKVRKKVLKCKVEKIDKLR